MYLKTRKSTFENKYKIPDASIKICESSYTVKSNNKTLCPITKYFKYPAFSHHISSFMACNLNSTTMHYRLFSDSHVNEITDDAVQVKIAWDGIMVTNEA